MDNKHKKPKISNNHSPTYSTVQKSSPRLLPWLAFLIFFIAFLPRVIHPNAISICYDEGAAKGTGEVLKLLKNPEATPEMWGHLDSVLPAQYIFGVLPELIFGSDAADPDHIAGARFFGALFGSGIVVITFVIASMFLPIPAAFLAAMLLSFIPSVLGHDRIAMHDAPSRLCAYISWWLILRWEPPRMDKNFLFSSLFAGVSLLFYHRTGTQSGIAIALWLAFYLFNKPFEWKRKLALYGTYGLIAFAGFYSFLWILWPYLRAHPFDLPKWFGVAKSIASTGGGLEFWFGKLQIVPWYYYFVALAISTPPITFGFFITWLLISGRRCLDDKYLMAIMMIFWVTIITASFSFRIFMVHYLQILYPVIAIAAAASIWQILDRYLPDNLRKPKSISLIASTAVIFEIIACLSVNPFFIEYFNILSGGGRRVAEKNTFTVTTYGGAIKYLFGYLIENGKAGSTVMCQLAAWPGITKLNHYLTPNFPMQGYQAVDPLGARYVLMVSAVKSDLFYRYDPDPKVYRKQHDVLAGQTPLASVWERRGSKELKGLCYYDDFSSPQFTKFAISGSNLNINVFSAGKIYALRANTPAFIVMKLPATFFTNFSSLRLEIDAQMLLGECRVWVGNNPNSSTEVLRFAGQKGTFVSKDFPYSADNDVFVIFQWHSRYVWDGEKWTFWNNDLIDALRVYGQ